MNCSTSVYEKKIFETFSLLVLCWTLKSFWWPWGHGFKEFGISISKNASNEEYINRYIKHREIRYIIAPPPPRPQIEHTISGTRSPSNERPPRKTLGHRGKKALKKEVILDLQFRIPDYKRISLYQVLWNLTLVLENNSNMWKVYRQADGRRSMGDQWI